MKIKLSSPAVFLALSFLIIGAKAQFDNRPSCEDCSDESEEADACFFQCDDAGYLISCFDDWTNLDNFLECCGFDFGSDCDQKIRGSNRCFEDCLAPCVTETAYNYLGCVASERCIGASPDCASSLQDNLYDEDSYEEINDFMCTDGECSRFEIFTYRAEQFKTYDCDIAANEAEQICQVGQDCCSDCQSYMSDFVECIMEDVLFDLGNNGLGRDFTIPTCDIDDCNDVLRHLDEDQRYVAERIEQVRNLQDNATATNGAETNGASTNGFVLSDDLNATATDKCQGKLLTELSFGDVKGAADGYFECILNTTVPEQAEDAPSDEEPAPTSASSKAVVGMMTMVTGIAAWFLF